MLGTSACAKFAQPGCMVLDLPAPEVALVSEETRRSQPGAALACAVGGGSSSVPTYGRSMHARHGGVRPPAALATATMQRMAKRSTCAHARARSARATGQHASHGQR